MSTAHRGRKRLIRISKDEEAWEKHGWTPIPNELIRNPELSIGARWAFSWMASHKLDWQMTALDLAEAGAIGINKAEAWVAELEKAGYLTRRYTRNGKGWITGVDYKLFPLPLPPEERTSGKRSKPKQAEPKQPKLLEVVPDPPAPD